MKRLWSVFCFLFDHKEAASNWMVRADGSGWSRSIDCACCGRHLYKQRTIMGMKPLDVF